MFSQYPTVLCTWFSLIIADLSIWIRSLNITDFTISLTISLDTSSKQTISESLRVCFLLISNWFVHVPKRSHSLFAFLHKNNWWLLKTLHDIHRTYIWAILNSKRHTCLNIHEFSIPFSLLLVTWDQHLLSITSAILFISSVFMKLHLNKFVYITKSLFQYSVNFRFKLVNKLDLFLQSVWYQHKWSILNLIIFWARFRI